MGDSEIILRRAVIGDIMLVYNWINDPDVRAQSFSQNHIGYEEHCKWFEKTILEQNCIYLIAMVHEIEIGQIRINISESEEGLISYLISKKFRGNGYGSALLSLAEEYMINLGKVKKLIGEVKSDNIFSIKAFEKNNYSKVNVGEKLIYSKTIGGGNGEKF